MHRSRTEVRYTNTYIAKSINGRRYRLIEHTDFLHLEDGQVIEGLKSYSLPNGEPVNKLSGTQFKTLFDGIELTIESASET